MIGILLTIGLYILALYMRKKFRSALLNPVLITAAFIIIIINLSPLTYEVYRSGAKYIGSSLGPIVVLLAIPLYKHRQAIKDNLSSIVLGILVSIMSSVTLIAFMSSLLGLDDKMMMTLLPKSITTPMAIEVSQMLEGYPNITVIIVIITGILGATLAPLVMKLGGIRSEVSKGIGIGAASHGIGTSKAMEMSDEAGAMSGLAMGLTGIIFVLLTSIYVLVFK